MRTFRLCSWCRHDNELHAGERVRCHVCSHRADVPRLCCDCPMCGPTPRPRPEPRTLECRTESER